MNPIINPRDRTILDLCGGTGSWSAPYRAKGYTVLVIDTDHVICDTPLSVEEFLRAIQRGDSWVPKKVHGILAAPPCTVFTKASSRLWGDYDADGRTDAALKVVETCKEIIDHYRPVWWALENPPGRLDDLWIPHTWTYVANNYGDPHVKRTNIWGTALRPLPTSHVDPTPNHALHRRGGAGAKTKTLRSITPPGFASAFCTANP